jgi:hypothetical protein
MRTRQTPFSRNDDKTVLSDFTATPFGKLTKESGAAVACTSRRHPRRSSPPRRPPPAPVPPAKSCFSRTKNCFDPPARPVGSFDDPRGPCVVPPGTTPYRRHSLCALGLQLLACSSWPPALGLQLLASSSWPPKRCHSRPRDYVPKTNDPASAPRHFNPVPVMPA